MTQILFSLLLGAVAGAIDAVPMIKKSPRFAVLLVFSQWVLLGLVIPSVSWEIQPWLKGLILGVLGMVPVMILVSSRNSRLIFPITLCGASLGSLIGHIGSLVIR
jgi:hypothetical protein